MALALHADFLLLPAAKSLALPEFRTCKVGAPLVLPGVRSMNDSNDAPRPDSPRTTGACGRK